MIVCYAQGGGLGHLTRVRAYLHTVYPGRCATIVTSSPFAADPRVLGRHRVICPPAGLEPPAGTPETAGERGLPGARELAAWLAATLRALAPRELVVDAFPAGLRGELSEAIVPRSVRSVTHLARLLRWEAYRPVVAGPPARRPLRFEHTWTVEPLTAEHHARIAALSGRVSPIDLVEPPPVDEVDPAGAATGAWLVVHAGPAAETAQLLAYARETAILEGVAARLVLVVPRRLAGLPADVEQLPAYPALPLFERAGRVVTAAGCNAVRQLAPWRERHRMLPFPRRFDDQFTRATRARTQWSTALGASRPW